MANQTISFYYDPQRQGYDTSLWKTLSGSPSVSSNKLRFNAAAAIQYGDVMRGELIMNMTVPAAPTGGDSRQFGFAQLNKGSYAYFDITGAVFSAKCSTGLSSTSSVIIWDSAQTNVAARYTIRWEAGLVKFFINGTLKATLSNDGATVKVTGNPMSPYINNANADNLDMTYLEVIGAQGYV